ncbi:ABC transporter permease subunit [Actinokineospora enzanensis]|uniref:ABC transporter permease subunit n=1 Tax=Actinokineospora enzanensis TaxID=155975 RepID=UPI0003747A51|nr:ABC transporter permease subunit [Actinokineospora enzanensis]
MTRSSLIAAEWTKLRSVRSTPSILAVATVATIGIAVLQAHTTVRSWDGWGPRARAEFDPVFSTFSGFQLAQLAFGLLGVLAVTAEYGTGTIRATFTATPRRGRVLAAKLLVVGTVALVAGEVLAFTSFFTGQFVLAGKHLDVGLGDPNVLRAVLGQGFYVATVTILGAAIGTLLRHTAGATALTTGLLFLATTVLKAVSPDDSTTLTHWAPGVAAEGLTWTTFHDPEWPTAGFGLFVCLTYLAVTVAAAAWSLIRRDV